MDRMDVGALAEGMVIADRFTIERKVAQGGMGIVYRAGDRISGAPVALKILIHGADQRDVSERFEQEAQILARLAHPRIVAYVAHGRISEEHLYLAMEWLDGHDLGEHLARGPLSLRDCRKLLEKVADALAYVHAGGLIHRDIKPSNIFLRAGNMDDPALVDFGIARGIRRTLGMTMTGTVLGTPNYMSPEQARGSTDISPASDIFSLGCVLYEVLTNTAPFAADHVAAVLAKILFDQPKRVSSIRPSVPAALEDLLNRMLAKDPGARPPNASALLDEISRLPDTPSDGAETLLSLVPPSHSHAADAEQALVSVILSLPAKPQSGDEAGPNSTIDTFNSIKMQFNRFGIYIDRMADGSMLATIIAKSSATDQARIAARCALFLRDQFNNNRISIATGRGQWQGTMPVGEAVERAARLLTDVPRSSESGIWMDEVTKGLLGARFDIRTVRKGLFELLSECASEDTGRLLLGRPVPCLGRELELAQLDAMVQGCADEGISNSIVFIAPPGMGKSRIRIEFLRRLQERYPDACVLAASGDPLSVGSPYGLLGQALRNHADIRTGSPLPGQRERLREKLCASIADSEKNRVAEFLGELSGVPFPSEQSAMLLAARRDPKAMNEQIQHAFLDFISSKCIDSSIILIVLEDMQWGDALTIQLLDVVLREKKDIPLLIAGFARPELRDAYPALWQGNLQEISLRPLGKKICERYVEEMLGDQKLGPDTLSRIVLRSAGNPLFLEELIRAASEGRADEIPETVLAMLQARLSRLSPEARRLLRGASIFGEHFWLGGLSAIAGNQISHSSLLQWLDILIKSEWIEKKRRSQFEQETEYAFRHALARDAAYSLLTESERVLGHKHAFAFLEKAGERDAITLAEHARLGQEPGRAIEYYLKAAEESLKRNDLAEAGRRAALGIECGAEGEALGILKAIWALSAFGLADWGRAGSLGNEALKILPGGHRYWYQVAEKLMHFLPTTGQLDRFNQLVAEIDAAKPLPDARSAQICVFAALVGVFGLVGIRDQVDHYSHKIEKIKGFVLDEDPYTKGVAHLYLGWASYFMEPNPYLSLVHAQQSEQIFEKTRILHNLGFARSLSAASRAILGDYTGAEQAFRSAMKIAGDVQEQYAVSHIKTYLALMIMWTGAPERLDEVQELALSLLDNELSHTYGAFARTTLANIHLRRGELSEAEEKARLACTMIAVAPPAWPICATVFIDVLVERKNHEAALSTVAEGLGLLKRTRGLGAFEIPFRVAAANAYFQAGKEDEGKAFLKDTLQEIEKRSNQIEDPFLKNCYLHQNIDSLRALELAQKWLPSGH